MEHHHAGDAGRRRRRGSRGLWAAALAVVVVSAGPARASWVEGTDLIYGTAHTLDEGEFEVGIFNPLQYGISDRVQIALHPVLLLILAPKAAVRWRVTPERAVTFAMNFEATWSFLNEIRSDGLIVEDSAVCRGCGFPGTVVTTGTVSFEPTAGLLLSVGGGVGADFLNVEPEAGFVEVHGSALWLIDADNLLMVHGSTNLHPWLSSFSRRSALQVMYARAFGFVHLGAGLAMGEFGLVVDEGTVRSLPGSPGTEVIYRGDVRRWPVWPVIDLWIRL